MTTEEIHKLGTKYHNTNIICWNIPKVYCSQAGKDQFFEVATSMCDAHDRLEAIESAALGIRGATNLQVSLKDTSLRRFTCL